MELVEASGTREHGRYTTSESRSRGVEITDFNSALSNSVMPMSNTAQESSRTRFESGFTLIELLISMTMLSIILGLLAAGLSTISRNWDGHTQKIDKLDMILRAYDLLRRDIKGLRRVTRTINGQASYLFDGGPSQLSFVAIEPPYPSRAGPFVLNYYVSGQPPGSALVRARTKYHAGLAAPASAAASSKVPVLQGNLQFRFSYAQVRRGQARWYQRWSFEDQLPDLIRLTVTARQQQGTNPVPSLVVRLRADAELNCTLPQPDICSPTTNGELRTIAARKDDFNNESELD